MSIRKVNSTQGITFSVYCCVASKTLKSLRVQKRSNGHKTEAEARRMEKQLFEKCLVELKEKESRGKKWREIVHQWYLSQKDSPYSKMQLDTLNDYFAIFKNWTSHLWEKEIMEITKGDARLTFFNMDEAGLTKGTQNRAKHGFNHVFKWAEDEGLVPMGHNPASGIMINRKSEKQPEALTVKEVRFFLDAAKKIEHPWYPVWAFAVLTGCRNGEIYAVTWDDVDYENGFIRISKSFNNKQAIVKSTKAGYWRNVPMNSDLRNLLIELQSTAFGREEVLPRLPRWNKGYQAKVLREFLRSIGLPSVKFHTLRACFATMLIQQGIAPATVMKICGWQDMDTMARYIRLAGIDEKGATDNLKLLPTHEAVENVVSILNNA